MSGTTLKIEPGGSDLSKHAEWPTKQTSCSSSVASGQQRCRGLVKIAVCAHAGEDFTCEWDDVFLRGNKKEVEWVGTWKGEREKD